VLGAGLSERLVDRVGSRVLCRICGVGSCAAVVTPGLSHTLPELMAGLFVIGVVGGTLDVAQNSQGVRVEAAYARPVMTSMHAFYSLGAILGSLAGGGLAWAGVALFPSLAAVGVVGALIDGTAGPWLLPENSRASTPGPAPVAPGTNQPDGPQGQLYWPDGPPDQNPLDLVAPKANSVESPSSPSAPSATEDSPDARRRVRRLVLALGVLGVCGLVGEGAAGDWSAVYLKDNLGTVWPRSSASATSAWPRARRSSAW
jgi:MFS family permease